jgi:predicted dinucleotide-binding enzyme
MQIGMIGAGSVACAFAKHLLEAGHQVLLSNSRGPETLKSLAAGLGPGATAVTIEQASRSPIVLLAVPWLKVDAALHGLPIWDNRIVIDATNQFTTPPELEDLHGLVSSEIISAKLPGARVVKALNTLYAERLAVGPDVGGGQRVVFVSGDDLDAKKSVSLLLSALRFAVVDMGSLHDGGLMQQAGGALAGLDLVKMP